MPQQRADRPCRLLKFLALAGVALALLTLLSPASASEIAAQSPQAAASSNASSAVVANAKSWGAFFGRLHVVVLHLPIGILAGAFVIEFFGLFRRSKGYDIAAAWLFVLGFVSSIVAVVSGLLLATEVSENPNLTMFSVLFADAPDGVSDTLGLHMWLGVALMIVAGVAAVLKVLAVKRQWPDDVATPDRGGWPLGVTRLALLAIVVLMPLVGHLGGNLVHGREFLTERTPSETVNKVIALMNLTGEASAVGPKVVDDGTPIEQGTVQFWNVKLQPVMNDHCIACHGPDKQNGKLRLDSLEWAIKGGSAGGTITPGDAEFSEIYRRVALPPSHDEFMPTNVTKYGMMSQEEVHALGDWLQKFNGKLEDAIQPSTTPQQATGTNKQPETTESKPLIDPAAIRAIEDAGGSAQSLSQEEDPDLLTVKFAYLKTLNPEALAKLGNTAGQVAWLTFEGSGFNDTAAQQMPALPKLTRLNLKDTAITDAGLATMPQLPSLEWLNLFGTKITDNSVDALKKYPSLKKLYVTGTAMTQDGVAKLRAALPTTEVFSDFDAQFKFAPATPAEPAAPVEPAAAKPVNTVCPVSGAAVKEGFVSTFEGKTVGFCCNNCKGQFDKEPAKFAAKLAN